VSVAAILLLVYVGLARGTSFLCSVLEAALLSTRELELSRRAEDGDKAAVRLLAIKRGRIDDAISAILTLNTIAHTVGATMAGAQAAIVFGEAWAESTTQAKTSSQRVPGVRLPPMGKATTLGSQTGVPASVPGPVSTPGPASTVELPSGMEAASIGTHASHPASTGAGHPQHNEPPPMPRSRHTGQP